MKLRRTTEEEAKAYMAKVEAWWEHARPMWSSTSFAAKSAVAEYLANQDGLTLYEMFEGDER